MKLSYETGSIRVHSLSFRPPASCDPASRCCSFSIKKLRRPFRVCRRVLGRKGSPATYMILLLLQLPEFCQGLELAIAKIKGCRSFPLCFASLVFAFVSVLLLLVKDISWAYWTVWLRSWLISGSAEPAWTFPSQVTERLKRGCWEGLVMWLHSHSIFLGRIWCYRSFCAIFPN